MTTLRKELLSYLRMYNDSIEDILAVWKLSEIDIDAEFDEGEYGLFSGTSLIVWTERNRYEFCEYDGKLSIKTTSRAIPTLTGYGMHRYIDL